MEDTATTAGEAVQSVSASSFLAGPRPKIYHRRLDGELQEGLLATLGTDEAIRFPLAGLTEGKISTLKNRVYRAAKRLREEHPALKLRTRVADAFLHAWLEQ